VAPVRSTLVGDAEAVVREPLRRVGRAPKRAPSVGVVIRWAAMPTMAAAQMRRCSAGTSAEHDSERCRATNEKASH
jgi:hypothetical protein